MVTSNVFFLFLMGIMLSCNIIHYKMIDQIYTYFTIEMIFMWLNLGVLPFWLVLIIFPQSQICKVFITSVFPFIVDAYLWIFNSFIF